jgi:hypothetical protein
MRLVVVAAESIALSLALGQESAHTSFCHGVRCASVTCEQEGPFYDGQKPRKILGMKCWGISLSPGRLELEKVTKSGGPIRQAGG